MEIKTFEKNGRLWMSIEESNGWILARGSTRVRIVRDPAIDEFLRLVERPEVSKAMMACKAEHECTNR